MSEAIAGQAPRVDISIIMPVTGRGRFLPEALASIQPPRDYDAELVVVADRLDHTARADAESFCKTVPLPARVIETPGRGIVDALNAGIRESTGRYVARMDADDRMIAGRLDQQARFLDNHPDCGVLGTQVEYITEDGSVSGRSQYPTEPGAIARALPWECPLAHPAVMMRREALAAVGGYRAVVMDDGTTLAEDYDLWLRLARAGGPGALRNLDAVLLQYRQHPEQVTSANVEATAVATLATSLTAFRASHGLAEAFPMPLELAALEPMVLSRVHGAAWTRDLPESIRREWLFRQARLTVLVGSRRRDRLRALVDLLRLDPGSTIRIAGRRTARHIRYLLVGALGSPEPRNARRETPQR